jgi:peptidoglycan-N-acetylglucosamine deacetylase
LRVDESTVRQPIITTSWDDGHPLDLRLAEMLERNGLTGTFYIPRRIETGVMADAQVRDLSNKFEIGAHTINHVFLADAPDAVAREEIAGSRKWVQDITGKPCPMFCPPAGKFNDNHRRMFKAAGFTGIRSVEFVSLDPPRNRGGLAEMPTTLQSYPHSAISYLRNFAKRKGFRNFWLYMSRGHARHWPTLSRRLLDRAVATGGVFHLWGHSWEIEASNQWVALEAVLRQMGEILAARKAICMTNGQLCERALAGSL